MLEPPKPPIYCSIKFLNPQTSLLLSKMMNLLSLSLLISSLAAAGFLSPHPDPNPPILKGHRGFVGDYERELPPPSASSPPPSPPPQVSGDLSGNFKHAVSGLANSLKDKISSAITKSKHRAPQLDESSADAVKGVSEMDAGEEVATTKKFGHRAEETAAKLEENVTAVMQRARDLGRDFLVHVAAGARTAARSSAAVAHLLGFVIAFGTCVWVTFASSRVLASALPRQQFGIVQSKIYPVYFGAVGFSVGAAVVAFYIGSGWQTTAERLQGYNLLGVLGMAMVNLLYLDPKATKVMFERMKLEKEDEKGRDKIADHVAVQAVMGLPATPPNLKKRIKVSQSIEEETVKSRMSRASKKLRRFNAYSSFLNVCSLMALSWHLVYLAQRLELSY